MEERMSGMRDLRTTMTMILCAAVACVFSTIGSASAKDIALTEDNVSRFLASFSEMRAIVITEGLQTGMEAQTSKNPVGLVVKAIKSSKLQTEAQSIAVKNGFADLKEWAETGKAIGQAYLFVTVGPARGIARETLDKNKDQAIKELEKLGLLNDKQKERLKENLDGLTDQLAREPPPQNVAVVQEMKPDIDRTVKLGFN
jgi:hypothetical protein